MNKILLMPIKNETWILKHLLKVYLEQFDYIILADQNSSDRPQEILRSEKITWIENKEAGHSNKVRWRLLDHAREVPGNNLIFFLDADEFIPPDLFESLMAEIERVCEPGLWLQFQWIQIWKSLNVYKNDDSVWSNSWKSFAFIDDRVSDYNRHQVVINDHIERLPSNGLNKIHRIENVPVIHLQWYYWDRAQLKQAWYRCKEAVNAPQKIQEINDYYKITLEDYYFKLDPTPSIWTRGVDIPTYAESLSTAWYLQEIESLFFQYGIEFFEPLHIWHNEVLKTQFLERTGRYPLHRPLVKRQKRKNTFHGFFKKSISWLGL